MIRNYCDYCYYYEDYTYLHSLWGFGHPMPHQDLPLPGGAAVQHHVDYGIAEKAIQLMTKVAGEAMKAAKEVANQVKEAKEAMDKDKKEKEENEKGISGTPNPLGGKDDSATKGGQQKDGQQKGGEKNETGKEDTAKGKEDDKNKSKDEKSTKETKPSSS
eukprot:c31559_g1_i1.p1 GENE.c31559_g1_i1~~c31559_g1_i1.p1  ORF type:complete len:160 (-),score=75.84 c31559_g1_i1:43-522(-)